MSLTTTYQPGQSVTLPARDSIAPTIVERVYAGRGKSIDQPLIKRLSDDLLWTVADRCPNLQPAILAELERREALRGHAAPNGGQR